MIHRPLGFAILALGSFFGVVGLGILWWRFGPTLDAGVWYRAVSYTAFAVVGLAIFRLLDHLTAHVSWAAPPPPAEDLALGSAVTPVP